MQLYLPPENTITKDFLKDVLGGKKRLLGENDVKRVNMPHYDELSVKGLWGELSQDPEFMTFMPDSFPKGKMCDRTYMFNILNTVHTDYT